MRPLNNLLDKLNYITLLTNVATAAYDADLIKNYFIELAKNNQTFIGFNNEQYTLSANDIVIKSNNNVICLGGIIGDNKYGVTAQTKNAIIEMANFDYVKIRSTATKFSLATDAAKRFSKPVAVFSTALAGQMLSTYVVDKTTTLT
jgi:phenylalanyl-tRNA synthetase beta chain